MSSAAAANNAGNNCSSQGRRDRRQTRQRPALEYKITLIYDNEVHQITIGDDQAYRDLQRLILGTFGIPAENQVIYGWPSGSNTAEDQISQDVLIKDLNLGSQDILLYVARHSDSSQSVQNVPVDNASETSRDVDPVSELNNQDNNDLVYLINVYDANNDESYNLDFNGRQIIRDVKMRTADLTNIPIDFQEWSGWPEAAVDDCMLRNAGLDTPFHSVIVMKLDVSNTVKIENDEEETHHRLNSDESRSPMIHEPDTISTSQLIIHSSSRPDETNDNCCDERNQENVNPVSVSITGTTQDCSSDTLSVPISSNSINEGSTFNTTSVNEYLTDPSFTSDRIKLVKDHQKPSSSRQALQQDLVQDDIEIIEEIFLNANDARHNNQTDNANSVGQRGESGFIVPVVKKRKHDSESDSIESLSQSQCNKRPKKNRESELLKFLQNQTEGYMKKAAKKLLEYIDPVTQLSLRRVCKTTKSWMASSVEEDNDAWKHEERWKHFRIEIDQTDFGFGIKKTFETFCNMGVPITRFCFNVLGEFFYQTPDNYTFLQHFGHRVKDITVSNFFMFQDENERALFQSFIRIEKLTINNLIVLDKSVTGTCPLSLANLQVLKLNYEITSPQHSELVRPKCWDFTWGMLEDCRSLLYFRFPKIREPDGNPIQTCEGIFTPLMNYMSEKESRGAVGLEYLDLKHFNNPDSQYISRFFKILHRCYSKDIKLKNVNSLVIETVMEDIADATDEKLEFCENIVSLVNYTAYVENAPFRNLEKISLDVVPSVTEYRTHGKKFKDIFWPKLKTIKIKDTKEDILSDKFLKRWLDIQEDLYGCVDGTFKRDNVTYIKIDSPKNAYFLSEGRLAEKFTNLTRLEITSWCVNDDPRVLNKRLIALWNNLKLEKLKITNCPKLNDYSFIGPYDEDGELESASFMQNPVFHKLDNTLKTLALGLDETNVTDIALVVVFSKMRLKNFKIIGSHPLGISEGALNKMKKRSFGRHIESFPFDTWSSSKIDAKRFERIGNSFRSLR